MAEEVKKMLQQFRKGGPDFKLADKAEQSSMMSLMNQVIQEREKKQENKKRDTKFTNKMAQKQEIRKKKEMQGMEQPKIDWPSMVESIFRPSHETFKG